MAQVVIPPQTPPGPDTVQDELRAMQAANAQLTRYLAGAQAELEDFTYSVAHDLRASLRHITSFVGLAREELGDQVPPDVASHLGTVVHAAQHMGRMIDSLTELSRLGRTELQDDWVDMGSLVNHVRAELSVGPSVPQVIWQVAEDFPPVRGDAALIRQLWRHVLSNALKYTRPKASARVQIGWQLLPGSQDAAHGLFFVKDNGVGFNPRFAHKLFHVFQRLHSAHEFDGLGMGLALTRKIVERHGGAVQAQGDVDAGCQISFTFPLADPARPPAGQV